MKFKYKEQTKEGKILEGIVESPDMFTLAKEIRERGSVPLSVKESDGKDHKFSFNFVIENPKSKILNHQSK